jgi:hypothetical protein
MLCQRMRHSVFLSRCRPTPSARPRGEGQGPSRVDGRVSCPLFPRIFARTSAEQCTKAPFSGSEGPPKEAEISHIDLPSYKSDVLSYCTDTSPRASPARALPAPSSRLYPEG